MKPPTARSIRRAGSCVLVGAVLAGCAAGGAVVTVQEQAGVSAVVRAESGSGMDAEFAGTVGVAIGGCVTIRDDGVEPIVVAWPEDTVLADDGQSLDVPGVGEVVIGSSIAGGGGELSELDPADYEGVPTDCLEPDLVLQVAKVTEVR